MMTREGKEHHHHIIYICKKIKDDGEREREERAD